VTPPQNPREVPAWPQVPEVGSAKVDDARLEQYKSQLAEAASRRSDFDIASHESHVAIEAAQIDVLKGSLERSRDSAKTIQTSATGIATLYTGLAALVFSVSDKKPLPLRGVIPVLFLGAAIVFASVFLAWLGPAAQIGPFPDVVDATGVRVERVKWLNNWVSLSVLRKAWALRLATLYLAGGLVLLPAAFIPIAPSHASTQPPASTTAKPPPWPGPPAEDNGVSRILYAAQVDEAAKARADAGKASSGTATSGFKVDEASIWLAALVFFLLATGVVVYQAWWGDLHRAEQALSYSPAPAG
jgi:hypothetical protein